MTIQGEDVRWWDDPTPPSEWGEGQGRELHWRRWERRFAHHVLSNAQSVRKSLGLSAKEVSERLTAAGWPVSVSSVNGILGKKGRESISVTQLMALADALETSPAMLMFSPVDDLIEVRPGEFVAAGVATDRFLQGALDEESLQKTSFDRLHESFLFLAAFMKGIEDRKDGWEAWLKKLESEASIVRDDGGDHGSPA